MNSTSESLLLRLKHADDHKAWARFVQLYTPLLFYWARKNGLQSQDAADLVQDVLSLMFQKLPEFTYDPSKSFRSWLRTVTLNRHREICRRKSLDVVDATRSALANIPNEKSMAESTWDLGYKKSLVSSAMNLLEPEFRPTTWQAVKKYVLTGQQASEIAREFGVSVWTIYAAKGRLMTRLREELDGLLE